ncbi:MFS transporter [Corynebacterium felinum]|uniref:MFS family permease n=1 Tax=Corynebacterium felinum TaxID=131318 RepID=A0ABU2BBJ5_9CORY|nr:MFS transporter [Corynebacterium felinum]MDF5819876.1 MFS transporter [Corynebacterium felinum]MDR7355981.1 MFS family permease [Corynebacterium felinum]WJY95317.1 Multidrug resistance protein MdtH [Corynebacterium felinum]
MLKPENTAKKTRDHTVFFALPLPVRLLLITQLLFNVGFYLVVPFLATFMHENLAATGAMIGLVLGMRTFSQQGLFFLGGALTDRFGVKPVLLTGIAIRVAGFILAGLSTSISSLMIAVILIGFAAALFSPAAEASFAVAGKKTEEDGIVSRAELFALDALFSRVGSLTGPVLGALLLSTGFPVMCMVAAGIFTLLFFAHACIVPAVKTPPSESVWASFSQVLRNRPFLIFAAAYSTGLVCYNQQYLALPVELMRATGNQGALGWMFVFASVFSLALQMPLARWAQAHPRTVSLKIGFGLMASAFAIIALCAPFPAPTALGGMLALAPSILMLILMHTGQMIALPIARDLVGVLAKEQSVGTYFGFLNSCGGVAVLLSSLIVGSLLDAATIPQPQAAFPWLVLTGMMAASAVVLPMIAARATR